MFDFEGDSLSLKCPACGGDIVENSKGFRCANWQEKGCKFTIWKKIAGKDIGMTNVDKLINTRETGVIKGFVSKNILSLCLKRKQNYPIIL